MSDLLRCLMASWARAFAMAAVLFAIPTLYYLVTDATTVPVIVSLALCVVAVYGTFEGVAEYAILLYRKGR